MLELGKSKPWPEALEKLTNKRTMDVGPLKEYFWPLDLWLRSQRCSLNYKIGWPEIPAPRMTHALFQQLCQTQKLHPLIINQTMEQRMLGI